MGQATCTGTLCIHTNALEYHNVNRTCIAVQCIAVHYMFLKACGRHVFQDVCL